MIGRSGAGFTSDFGQHPLLQGNSPKLQRSHSMFVTLAAVFVRAGALRARRAIVNEDGSWSVRDSRRSLPGQAHLVDALLKDSYI